MIKNKLTNEIYNNRQEAKKIMGHSNYNKAVRHGDIEYVVTAHDASDVIL